MDGDSKYNNALVLYALGDYGNAANILHGLKNYKESESKLKEAEYAYVKSHLDNTDSTTYSYLLDLKAAGYSDSKTIYDDLYAWKAEIVFNTSEKDYTTKMDSISRYSKIYVHVKVTGGIPGESIKLKYSYKWPTALTENDSWDFELTHGNIPWVSTWLESPGRGVTGEFSFSVYTFKGTLLATDTVTINIERGGLNLWKIM